MTIPAEVFNEAVAVLGRTGSGKTFAAKGAIETLLARGERVCVLDPTGVWWGLRSSADGKKPGFQVAVFGGEHGDVAITEASAEPLAKLIAERNLAVIIDLSEIGMGARTRFATHFLEKLYAANKRPLTIVFDEADLFAPQRPMPDQTILLNRIEQIVRRGRVKGFRPWMITQRPAELHKSVLSQAGTLIAMKLPAPQDRDAIGAWIDGQGDREEGKKLLATLPKLTTGEGFLWCPAIDFLERMTFPPITTFDSGRTPEHGETIEAPEALADVDLSGVLEALKPAEEPAKKGAKAAPADPGLPSLAEEYQRGYSDGELAGYERGFDETLARCRAAYQAAENTIFIKWPSGQPAEATEYTKPGTPGEPGATARATAVPAPTKAPEARIATAAPGRRAEGVSGPQQKLLDTLARLASLFVTHPDRMTLAVMADVSESSSSYGNNLGALRTAGLIDYPIKGRVTLTTEGRKAANHPTRALTTADLQAAWMDAVSGPQAAILRVLIQAFPRSIHRDRLAELVEVSPGSSSYGNNLGRLRTLGAIDYPSRGEVSATAILFFSGSR